MENFLLLEMPLFKPVYEHGKQYGYSKPDERANLQTALILASRGYCMYCYSRIFVDGKFYGQLEHAIEKYNSEYLGECVPNIGISCALCNGSFKRVGERKRRLSKELIDKFHQESKCTKEQRMRCEIPCSALWNLQSAYLNNEESKIVLQPMGVKGENREELRIQYDVLRGTFKPAVDFHDYSEQDVCFIQEHIDRFHLNDLEYQPYRLRQFVKNVIDGGGRVPEYEYSNLVTELFAEKLKGKSQEYILKVCNAVYLAGFLSA